MAALIAAFAAQTGDRTAWLAAILGDRYRRPWQVVAAAGLALASASVIAVALGTALAPRLTPEARLAVLAIALIFQGGGAFFPLKAPDRLTGWRTGAALTSFVGLFILAFGDGVQFIIGALAMRSPLPWLAAIGATIGSLAVVAPAAIIGERAWLALPLRSVRLTAAVAFLLTGTFIGLSAMRLLG